MTPNYLGSLPQILGTNGLVVVVVLLIIWVFQINHHSLTVEVFLYPCMHVHVFICVYTLKQKLYSRTF